MIHLKIQKDSEKDTKKLGIERFRYDSFIMKSRKFQRDSERFAKFQKY